MVGCMRRYKRIALTGGVALAVVAVAMGPRAASAESLRPLIAGLLDGHNLIDAAQSDLKAAAENVEVAYGGWYPALDVTSHAGYEQQIKPGGTEDTRMPSKELDVTVTQKLWDFGATGSAIRSAKLTRSQAEASLQAARQNLALRGVVAYLNVLRASRIVEFAQRSEANIKVQTQLEGRPRPARRRFRHRRAAVQAASRPGGSAALPGRGPVATGAKQFPGPCSARRRRPWPRWRNLPCRSTLLPPTVDEAIAIAREQNPLLEAALLGAEVSREAIKAAQAAGFYPTFNGVVSWKAKSDVGGTAGHQYETLGKVEMNFPFNLGLTATNSVRAARGTYNAANSRYADARDLVEQQVRDGWENLRVQRERANALLNAANIAAEFPGTGAQGAAVGQPFAARRAERRDRTDQRQQRRGVGGNRRRDRGLHVAERDGGRWIWMRSAMEAPRAEPGIDPRIRRRNPKKRCLRIKEQKHERGPASWRSRNFRQR